MSFKPLLLIASATISAISPILVQADESVETRTVNYAGIDLSTSQGAAMLYAHLKNAATAVCRNLESRQLSQLALHEACVGQALDEAVRRVDRVKLSQLHHAKDSNAIHLASR